MTLPDNGRAPERALVQALVTEVAVQVLKKAFRAGMQKRVILRMRLGFSLRLWLPRFWLWRRRFKNTPCAPSMRGLQHDSESASDRQRKMLALLLAFLEFSAI